MGKSDKLMVDLPEDCALEAEELPISLNGLIDWYNNPNAVTSDRLRYFDALCRHVLWLGSKAPKQESNIDKHASEHVQWTRQQKLDACDCWMLGSDNMAHCKRCNPTRIEGGESYATVEE